MSSAKRILIFFKTFIGCLALFFLFEGIVYSENKPGHDSINVHIEFPAKSYQNMINDQKVSTSFYKNDSIFSFHSEKGYIPSLFHNIGEQASAPFRFSTREWAIGCAVVGTTIVLIYSDEDIDSWARIQKEKHNWVNKSSPYISEFGSHYGVYSVIATGLISAVLKNEKGVQTSLLATQAIITSGIWTQLIKQLTGRERPKAAYIFSGSEGGKWHGPFAKYLEVSADDRSRFSYDAFPSGHTATAFSIATVFATQYKDTKAIPFLCYSAATLVGISRLTQHEHWASDVFAGAILGYLSGKQVVKHYNKTHSNSLFPYPSDHINNTQITLLQNGNQIGFSIKW